MSTKCEENKAPSSACKLYISETTGEIKDVVNANMSEIREHLIKIDGNLEINTAQTAKLSKIVIGNGVKGLAETSREFEAHIIKHDKKENRTLKIIGAMLLVLWQIGITGALAYIVSNTKEEAPKPVQPIALVEHTNHSSDV